MPGGIEKSTQFIGIALRKPYSEDYGPTLQRYENTESGITEAHGHADQLAEKLNVPREAIRVSRFGSSTSMTDEVVPRPTSAPKGSKPKAVKTIKSAVVNPAKTPAKPKTKSKSPAVDVAVVTKDGKSTSYKLGGK
jgi:hypothetical protein